MFDRAGTPLAVSRFPAPDPAWSYEETMRNRPSLREIATLSQEERHQVLAAWSHDMDEAEHEEFLEWESFDIANWGDDE